MQIIRRPQCKLNSETFEAILSTYSYKAKRVSSVSEYLSQKIPYKDIIYDDEYLICSQKHIEFVLDDIVTDDRRDYRQFVCRLDEEQDKPFIEDLTPIIAKACIHRKLHEAGLTNEDIDARLDQFKKTKEEHKPQWHFNSYPKEHIALYKNCYYYDINKAHSECLSIIFPEIKDYLIDLARRAKTDKRLKNIPNYYVGLLAHDRKDDNGKVVKEAKHKETYYWIVDYVANKLEKFYYSLDDINTQVRYANTDGVIIQNPTSTPAGSDKFGEFKLEYAGDLYATQNEGGWMIQYGDEIKSCIKRCLRKDADLRIGKAVRQFNNKTQSEYIYKEIKEY